MLVWICIFMTVEKANFPSSPVTRNICCVQTSLQHPKISESKPSLKHRKPVIFMPYVCKHTFCQSEHVESVDSFFPLKCLLIEFG